MLPLIYTGDKEERENKAKQAVISAGLGHRLTFTNQLSGGEKQRVAIAASWLIIPGDLPMN